MLEPCALAKVSVDVLLVSQNAHVNSVSLELVSKQKQSITVIFVVIGLPLANFLITIVISYEPNSINNIERNSLQKYLHLFSSAEAFAGNKGKISLKTCIFHVDEGICDIGINTLRGWILTPCSVAKSTSQNTLHAAHSWNELTGENADSARSQPQEGSQQNELGQ